MKSKILEYGCPHLDNDTLVEISEETTNSGGKGYYIVVCTHCGEHRVPKSVVEKLLKKPELILED